MGVKESALNISTTCSRINAAFPPLCCYSQTDVCRHSSSSSLDEGVPAVFHCKTSAGGSDKYTLNSDRDVMIATSLPLCILWRVARFSRERFKTSSLCDSFIATCHRADDGPYWVCGWVVWCVYVGVGHITGINVTVMVPWWAKIGIWLNSWHQHPKRFVTSPKMHSDDRHNSLRVQM